MALVGDQIEALTRTALLLDGLRDDKSLAELIGDIRVRVRGYTAHLHIPGLAGPLELRKDGLRRIAERLRLPAAGWITTPPSQSRRGTLEFTFEACGDGWRITTPAVEVVADGHA